MDVRQLLLSNFMVGHSCMFVSIRVMLLASNKQQKVFAMRIPFPHWSWHSCSHREQGLYAENGQGKPWFQAAHTALARSSVVILHLCLKRLSLRARLNMMLKPGTSAFGTQFWLVSALSVGLDSSNGSNFHETQPSHCICVHCQLRTQPIAKEQTSVKAPVCKQQVSSFH